MIFKNRDLLVPKCIKKTKKSLKKYIKKSLPIDFIDPDLKVLVFAILFIYFFHHESKSIDEISKSFIDEKLVEKYLKNSNENPSYKLSISVKEPILISKDKYLLVKSYFWISKEIFNLFTSLNNQESLSNDFLKIFEYAIYLFLINYHAPKFSLSAIKNLNDESYEQKIQATKDFCNDIANWYLLIRTACPKNCNNIIKSINFLLEKLY